MIVLGLDFPPLSHISLLSTVIGQDNLNEGLLAPINVIYRDTPTYRLRQLAIFVIQ